MSDGEAIRKLSSLKGIGVWTEEMGYLKREVIALFICKPPINQGFKDF